MKQQISAHLTPIEGQLSAHLSSIDYQSQHAQASAQIVRKNKYAPITLSSGYTSHAKQKKVNVPKAGIRSSGLKIIPSRLVCKKNNFVSTLSWQFKQ